MKISFWRLSFLSHAHRLFIIPPIHPLTIFLIGFIGGIICNSTPLFINIYIKIVGLTALLILLLITQLILRYKPVDKPFYISTYIPIYIPIYKSIYKTIYKSIIIKISIITFGLIAGLCWSWYRSTDTLLPQHILNKPITVKGIITEIEPVNHKIMRQQITISIHEINNEIKNETKWEKINFALKIYTACSLKACVGDTVILGPFQHRNAPLDEAA